VNLRGNKNGKIAKKSVDLGTSKTPFNFHPEFTITTGAERGYR